MIALIFSPGTSIKEFILSDNMNKIYIKFLEVMIKAFFGLFILKLLSRHMYFINRYLFIRLVRLYIINV